MFLWMNVALRFISDRTNNAQTNNLLAYLNKARLEDLKTSRKDLQAPSKTDPEESNDYWHVSSCIWTKLHLFLLYR